MKTFNYEMNEQKQKAYVASRKAHGQRNPVGRVGMCPPTLKLIWVGIAHPELFFLEIVWGRTAHPGFYAKSVSYWDN